MASKAGYAAEVAAAAHDAPAIGHRADEPCANCQAVRHGPFCHQCGQAGHVHRTLHALVHDLAHGVFHFEGRIWRTLPLLAWRPGELTRRYVMGERAKFVSPIALFLFAVFLLFAIVPHLTHLGEKRAAFSADLGGKLRAERAAVAVLDAQVAATTDATARARLTAQVRAGHAKLDEMERVADFTSAEADGAAAQRRQRAIAQNVRSDWPWLNEALHHAAANPDLTLYKLKSYGYKYSWALIPISVPFLWLLFFWRRDITLYDHAIFAIYSLSFMSLAFLALVALSWVGVPTVWIGLAVLLVPPVHMYRQLQGAYRLGWLGAVWRTLALLVVTGVTSILFMLFVVWMGSD